MADTMRPMSLLPTIKCSNCGVDIEIAMLAEHICSSTSPNNMQPTSPQRKLDRAATFGSGLDSKTPALLKPGRMPPPPRIDSSAANKPFQGRDQLTPLSNNSDPRSISPLSPKGSSRAPYKMMRSATSPMPRPFSPPSPDLPGNMDCAFPPFPTSRSATPTEPRSRPRERLDPAHSHRYASPDPLYAPLSPRTNGGESVLKRMNTIAPGPFDARGGNSADRSMSASRAVESGHKRSATQTSISSAGKGHAQRPSTAGSMRSRSSTMSNGSVGLPANPKPGPPARPPRSEGIDAFLERLQTESYETSNPPLKEDVRSMPLRKDSREAADASSFPRPRRPSESSNSFARPANAYPTRSSSRNGSRSGVRPEDAPPLPRLPNMQQPLPPKSLHIPSDSGSSDDSTSSSALNSATSSRSSPPASETWGFARRPSKPAIDSSAEDRIPRMASPEPVLGPSAQQMRMNNRNDPGMFNRGNAPQPLLKPLSIPVTDGPESPMDPAIQRGLFHTKRPSKDSPISPIAPPNTLPVSPPRTAPGSGARALSPSSVNRRPTTATKGKCRGCEKPIVGKSIKAADGRLTGRYHKQCFVCKTCRAPFQTADFYVINNFPYCEQHYHQLNGSLCKACNRGIEGQYLETDLKQKFHPKCFSCLTCRIPLRDDYFEVGGKIFCERHAAHAASQNTFLGARRNPERRTTRLMMMM